MHVSRSLPSADAIAGMLGMLEKEMARTEIGSQFVGVRLAELLTVEAIRTHAANLSPTGCGWLGALADPRLGRALLAIHRDITRPWTVADLASEAGMSRAAFSAAFTDRAGQPPLSYLRRWRLPRAQAMLRDRHSSVAAIAASAGYASQSAFCHAFARMFG